MTPRDRMLLRVLVVAAVLAGIWLVVLAPRREEAHRLDHRISATRAEVDRLEGLARGTGRVRREGRPTVAELERAIPATLAMPALLREMQSAARREHVTMEVVTVAAADASAATATNASAAAPGATGSAESVGTTTLTLSLRGGFADLRRLLARLQRGVRVSGDGVAVSGRLLSVGSLGLTRETGGVTAKAEVSVFSLPHPSASSTETAP